MARYFDVHPDNPQPRAIQQVVGIIRDGGLIVYPTDSCYALGCALDAAGAVARLRAIRGIDDRHRLTLVCRDLAQAGRYARLDNWQFRVVRQGIPGPYTFVLPATREVPRRIKHARHGTLGIRVPAHVVATALVDELGDALLSSSLILPGDDAPLNDGDAIEAALGRRIDAFVDAGPCAGEPSTVIDLSAEPGEIVRRGLGDPAALGLA